MATISGLRIDCFCDLFAVDDLVKLRKDVDKLALFSVVFSDQTSPCDLLALIPDLRLISCFLAMGPALCFPGG